MWLSAIAQLAAVAVIAQIPQTGVPASPTAMPEPIVTRQTLFSIPFRIEPPTQASEEPKEVQLYVSGDRGASWQLYSKVEPTRRNIKFRAGVDGEFWFIIRTLDRADRLRPPETSPPAPGLRVVVDTTLPKVQLEASRGTAGQIILRWQIEEAHPKADGLTVQYRAGAAGQWQPVAVDRRGMSAAGPVQTGEVTWVPPVGSEEIQIRAEFTDAAGNLAVSNTSVKPGQAGEAGPSDRTVQKPLPEWRPGSAGPPPTQWPADRSSADPLALTAPAAGQGAPPVNQSVIAGVNPPIQNQFLPAGQQTAISASNSSSTGNGLPAGERPRMVNSRLFELEYDLDAVGPGGVTKVELWATRDGGQTWRSFALDNDNRSPILVKVDEEGIYGFRVAVANAAGQGGKPPLSGDLPDILIGVDLTKPTVRIISTEQGTGPDTGKLVISWQAEDKLLAVRPISLSLSPGPNGPWTPIATGLENTGRYAWPVDSRAPRGVYIRVEARDEAGNVGQCESGQCVALDHSRPGVRIRDVRPLGESAQTPRHYYFR